jgi:hypothetical protein
VDTVFASTWLSVVFGTIAYMTRSTLPALPVHIAGDLLFFVVIWPGTPAAAWSGRMEPT